MFVGNLIPTASLMKNRFTYLIPLLILLIMGTQASAQRKILVFGKQDQPALVDEQLKILDKAAAGVKERDLQVTVVGSADPLGKKFKVKPGQFTVLLIGKDGGEKHRSNQPVSAAEFFAMIDAMPMRQQEMRSKDQ